MIETIQDSLKWGRETLQKNSVENPRLDCEVLLAKALDMERHRLLLEYQRVVDQEGLKRFKSFIERRALREPVGYITGEKEFWSLNFKITRDVLIPRPETEFLIEGALEAAREIFSGRKSEPSPLNILDIGTGCGNIPIALAKEIKNSFIYALDRSDKALKVAGENLDLYSVRDRVFLIRGDVNKGLCFSKNGFDIIISNPPYVSADEIKTLLPEVRDFEPMDSLNGGKEGLDLINEIIIKSPYFLKEKGFLILEIGKGQRNPTQRMIEKRGTFSNLSVKKDLAGIERVVMAQKVK